MSPTARAQQQARPQPASPTATVTGASPGKTAVDQMAAGRGVSRRALIANAALAGTAVLAAPALRHAVTRAATDEPPFTGQLDEPIVARVLDPRTGVIDIFFGEEHIVLRDRAIAARLAKAVS
jgi:hypothetical protein